MPSSPTTSSEVQTPFRDRDWVRQKSFSNLHFFETAVCSEAWADKYHDFGHIQKLMCDFLQDSSYTKKFISAFRLSFKTTVLAGYVSWLFCLYLARKRPMSIVYNTYTKENSWNFQADVRQTLMENDFLRWVMPELPRSEKDYDVVSMRRIQYKHVRIDFASTDSTLVSRHYPIWINDDLENDRNIRTQYLRDELKTQWRYQKAVLTKIRKKGLGIEVDVGTPYNFDGLIWMIRNLPSYKRLVIPYRGKDGLLTMPELYCEEDFAEKREDVGPYIFSCQYELRPLAEEDALCREKWVKYWSKLPIRRWRSMVIDPGGTDVRKHDATGITIVDTDVNGDWYVVYAEEMFLTPNELIEKIESLRKIYIPDDTRIEKEKFGTTIADIYRHRFPLMHISFVEHHGARKEDRIWRLRQWFEAGRIYFGRMQRKLVEEATTYTGTDSIPSENVLDSLAYHVDIRRIPGELDVHRLPSGKIFEPNVEEKFSEELDNYMKKNEIDGEDGCDANY